MRVEHFREAELGGLPLFAELRHLRVELRLLEARGAPVLRAFFLQGVLKLGAGQGGLDLLLADPPAGPDGLGPDVFRMRVDRVSDSRFDRMALLEFLDRREEAGKLVSASEQEMHYLHQRVFWRIDAGEEKADWDSMPKPGDELWMRIPEGKIYIVSK